MKVFTGIMLVALAVTSASADKSSNLRSTPNEKDVNDKSVKSLSDSQDTPIIIDSNAYIDSCDKCPKYQLLDAIGYDSSEVRLEDIIKAYDEDNKKPSSWTKHIRKGFAKENDWDDEFFQKSTEASTAPPQIKGLKSDDSEIQDPSESVKSNDDTNVKSKTNVKHQPLDDDSDDSNTETNVKGTIQGKDGADDSLWGDKPLKSKPNVKSGTNNDDDVLNSILLDFDAGSSPGVGSKKAFEAVGTSTGAKDKFAPGGKLPQDEFEDDDTDLTSVKGNNLKGKKSMDEEDVNQEMQQSEADVDDEDTKL